MRRKSSLGNRLARQSSPTPDAGARARLAATSARMAQSVWSTGNRDERLHAAAIAEYAALLASSAATGFAVSQLRVAVGNPAAVRRSRAAAHSSSYAAQTGP